jgi:hypothetical protein
MWILFVFTTMNSFASTAQTLEMCQQQFQAAQIEGEVTKAYCQTFFGDRIYLVLPRAPA